MAENNIKNKVIFNGETLIDLTNDTIVQSDILSGKYAHLPNGQRIQGSCSFDADTKDATAQASEIINGKTAYVNGSKITGSMPNIGKQENTINSKNQEITISQGYHNGSGKVKIDDIEKAKIIPDNIRKGMQILGIDGTYEGSTEIPYTETLNSAGGYTVTIG